MPRNSISRDARKAFEIEGIDGILENVSRVLTAARGKQVKEVYHRAGSALRDRAKMLAPYDWKRKEGTHLRAAIFVDRGRPTAANVLVGVRYKHPGAPHAHLLEYGTVKMAARPYFRPAMTQTGPAIAAIIKDGLGRIIEDAAK